MRKKLKNKIIKLKISLIRQLKNDVLDIEPSANVNENANMKN